MTNSLLHCLTALNCSEGQPYFSTGAIERLANCIESQESALVFAELGKTLSTTQRPDQANSLSDAVACVIAEHSDSLLPKTETWSNSDGDPLYTYVRQLIHDNAPSISESSSSSDRECHQSTCIPLSSSERSLSLVKQQDFLLATNQKQATLVDKRRETIMSSVLTPKQTCISEVLSTGKEKKSQPGELQASTEVNAVTPQSKADLCNVSDRASRRAVHLGKKNAEELNCYEILDKFSCPEGSLSHFMSVFEGEEEGDKDYEGEMSSTDRNGPPASAVARVVAPHKKKQSEDRNEPNQAFVSRRREKPEDSVAEWDITKLGTTSLAQRRIAGSVDIKCRCLSVQLPLQKMRKKKWTSEEGRALRNILQTIGTKGWVGVSEQAGTLTTPMLCPKRWISFSYGASFRRAFAKEEDDRLKYAVQLFGYKDWKQVASVVGGRNSQQCMNRYMKRLAPGRRVGKWLPGEIDALQQAVQKYGTSSWVRVAKEVPGRTDVQCREKWVNSLDTKIKREPWSANEDKLLAIAVTELGRKWSRIAKRLDGRSDVQCLRRWKILQKNVSKKAKKTKQPGRLRSAESCRSKTGLTLEMLSDLQGTMVKTVGRNDKIAIGDSEPCLEAAVSSSKSGMVSAQMGYACGTAKTCISNSAGMGKTPIKKPRLQ